MNGGFFARRWLQGTKETTQRRKKVPPIRHIPVNRGTARGAKSSGFELKVKGRAPSRRPCRRTPVASRGRRERYDRMGLLSNWSARARKVLEPESGTSNEAPPRLPVDDDMTVRMSWDAICRSAEFRGRWVALDECRYDEATGKATEGAVVDVDDDLVELCARIRQSERKNCAILFCGDDDESTPTH